MRGTVMTENPDRRRLRGMLSTGAGVAVLAMLAAGCSPEAAPEPAKTGQAVVAEIRGLLPDEVRKEGVIRIGTDAAYAPASFFAADGRTVVGFEPDLAQALGEVLGVDVAFVVTDFDDVLNDLDANHIDVVMTAMTDTVEREARADFVNYFRAGTSIVVQRGNPQGITQLRDLCGQVVAVENGTTQVDLLERSQQGCAGNPIQVGTFDTNDDALVELRTGRATAVLNDYPPAAYLTSNERTQGDYQLASDVQYEPGMYGMAIEKQDEGLRDALQAALEHLVGSGAYEAVLTKWGVERGRIETVSVNGASSS